MIRRLKYLRVAMNELPIVKHLDEITELLTGNKVVIVNGETGTGKTTQLPWHLAQATGKLVYVTSPRRLPAEAIATRVAYEQKQTLGDTVGFRTAVASKCSPATRVLYRTDGIAVVHALYEFDHSGHILIVDEVHERNMHIDVLLAWIKIAIEEHPDLRVVLMSATMDTERLSNFFGGAPIVNVEGRTYPIEHRSPGESIVEDVMTLVQQENRNVLVFLPGKREIDWHLRELRQRKLDAHIFPLHRELSPAAQARCLRPYHDKRVVILATNIAETSLTPPGITAVVDSALERFVEVRDGVQGLYLGVISLDKRAQRAGRAGRVEPGVAIDHCPPTERRRRYTKPEIVRTKLHAPMLQLAAAGYHMEDMVFFTQPNAEAFAEARQTLINLGCLTDTGTVTEIGALVNALPVDTHHARMVAEGQQLGILQDAMDMVAVLEAGGITLHAREHDTPLWRQYIKESDSDIVAQVMLFREIQGMTDGQMRHLGASPEKVRQAKEVLALLSERIHPIPVGDVPMRAVGGRRNALFLAFAAGMRDRMYLYADRGWYNHHSHGRRRLSHQSVVNGPVPPEWILAIPFDLQRKDRKTFPLLQMAWRLDDELMKLLAEQLAIHPSIS